jgi:hypothetical protein
MTLKTDFHEAMEIRRQWEKIFEMFKEKYCQLQILYLEKLSFKNKIKIRTLPHKQKLKEFVISNLPYKEY